MYNKMQSHHVRKPELLMVIYLFFDTLFRATELFVPAV